jgi:hypothetical protein
VLPYQPDLAQLLGQFTCLTNATALNPALARDTRPCHLLVVPNSYRLGAGGRSRRYSQSYEPLLRRAHEPLAQGGSNNRITALLRRVCRPSDTAVGRVGVGKPQGLLEHCEVQVIGRRGCPMSWHHGRTIRRTHALRRTFGSRIIVEDVRACDCSVWMIRELVRRASPLQGTLSKGWSERRFRQAAAG